MFVVWHDLVEVSVHAVALAGDLDHDDGNGLEKIVTPKDAVDKNGAVIGQGHHDVELVGVDWEEGHRKHRAEAEHVRDHTEVPVCFLQHYDREDVKQDQNSLVRHREMRMQEESFSTRVSNFTIFRRRIELFQLRVFCSITG